MKNNRPKIRFKGFSEEWEDKTLGEITHITTGNSNRQDSGLDGKYTFFDRSEDVRTSNIYLFDCEAVIVAGEGSDFAPKYFIGKFDLHQRSYAIMNFQNSDGKFIFYYIHLYRRYFLSQAVGSTVKSLRLPMFQKMPITLSPVIKEQTKIGNHFKNLDKLISNHQNKYDKLRNVKKAMLEKMFPKTGATVPEIRFKGFSEDWEEFELGAKVDFFTGLTYSPIDVIKEGGTFVIRSSNVKNGEIVYGNNVFVNSDVVNSDNVKKGDLIVVVRNGSRSLIGKHAQIKENMKSTVIGAFMTGIRSEQPTFINALLDTNQYSKEIEKNLGATINQITTGAFKKMQFMFPNVKEQKKIGNFFINIDNLIHIHKKEIDKLKNIKKAMLEKMFV